ncbi:LuxR family transcriptional regulator [Dactylosporangium sucinum]|uniref:LuxR family transcriptional regulator n=1 Tax=Dactylosporangium sucinum TaxID=1424081 RepID=A0A917UC30_9ACTN|nr:LuxR family transcriptional regulator [Dactylosporangium sucinum]
MVTGAVGTGKTRLTHTFAERAIAAGAIYCDATASRMERGLQFGVLSQLLLGAELPAEFREQAARLLEAGAMAAQSAYFGAADDDGGNIPSTIVCNLSILLRDAVAGADRPLVLTIDDAHHADEASLQCLSFVLSRLWRARAMLVISAATGPRPFNPVFLADLPPEPYSRRIRLDPLSRAGVEEMLAARLGAETAARLSHDCHRISGGNPALVRGLIDDCRRQGGDPDGWQLTIGPETVLALLGILHRSDPSLLRTARWLAVLGGVAAPVVADRLVGLDSESLTRTVAALNRIGVLDDGRFRHPRLRAAVLDGLAPDERAKMHASAAQLLRVEGAAPPVIADHILGADGLADDWAAPVLDDAAAQALADGEVNRALSYLRLAYRMGTDNAAPLSPVTRELLARAEWRADPALAMRHDTDPAADGERAMSRAVRLMWFGRVEQTREALDRAGTDQPPSARLEALRAWQSWLYPNSGGTTPTGAVLSQKFQRTTATASPTGQAISLLVTGLTDGTGESAIAAEHALHESRLEEQSVPLLLSALAALVCAGKLGVAAKWADTLQQDAAAQQAPTWNAMFTAMQALVALRQGNLSAAETHARAALMLIPASSWGIGIGVPLAVLIEASTAMGRFNDAFSHLRTPVPEAMFASPFGLLYLCARGRFHYAREDYRSALRDFDSVGHLAAQWQMDYSGLVVWRTDAALAHLRLGQAQAAHDLALDQLKRLTPANVRERGIALRVVAACSDVPKRPVRLGQAVKELQNSGDRLELAYALADLSQAYHALGEIGQARRISRRAYQIAKQCGACVLARSLLPDAVGGGSDDSDSDAAPTPYTGLSQAERRVAALAADGYSNRQIASTLFVTVSTVEQHLTRVYSKLKVSRRGDLPMGLLQDVGERSFPLPEAGEGF